MVNREGRVLVSRGWDKIEKQMSVNIDGFSPESAGVVVPRLEKVPRSLRGRAHGLMSECEDMTKIRWPSGL